MGFRDRWRSSAGKLSRSACRAATPSSPTNSVARCSPREHERASPFAVPGRRLGRQPHRRRPRRPLPVRAGRGLRGGRRPRGRSSPSPRASRRGRGHPVSPRSPLRDAHPPRRASPSLSPSSIASSVLGPAVKTSDLLPKELGDPYRTDRRRRLQRQGRRGAILGRTGASPVGRRDGARRRAARAAARPGAPPADGRGRPRDDPRAAQQRGGARPARGPPPPHHRETGPRRGHSPSSRRLEAKGSCRQPRVLVR